MMLDLSALDDDGSGGNGKPLELPLTDIEEDPNQPRKTFSEVAMAEITASIAERGVKTPVSVRRHPDKYGKYILNYGARRYRGSLAAGRKSIPAFIDEDHDDFDQVIENEQRDNLRPMELALFVYRKVGEGIKKADIARRLGKPAPMISEYLALIDMPASLEAAYRADRISSPKTIYELRNLYEKFPADVEKWVEGGHEISRRAVDELSKRLKVPAEPARPLVMTKELKETKAAPVPAPIDDKHPLAKTPVFAKPESLTRPKVMIEYKGRPGILVLDRRPPMLGFVYIRLDSDLDHQDVEVVASECTISMIVESE